ncbi:MAG: LytR/AlgR family response regulator transcription factor [Janthinobacterium lividum]
MHAPAVVSLRCVAVDDEPMALNILRAHAAKVPFISQFTTFASATEAVAYLYATPADVVFLDIEMPDVSGLEIATQLPENASVIFTTAHPQFAVQGFELAVTDFLLKPIGFERFWQACTRAQQRASSLAPLPPASLFVKDGYTWVRIDVADLNYLEAAGNYLTFHESGRRTVVRLTLTEALAQLPAGQFLRVHKSYAVALAHVEKIERHQVTLAGKPIPLSPTGREELVQQLKKSQFIS